MIRGVDLIKIYEDPVTEYNVAALRGLDIDVDDGELVSIIGPSGSGKTTLINIISGRDIPNGGLLIVDGLRIDKLTEKERRSFRYENIGIVNQFASQNLFSHLTVRENLIMPMKFRYKSRKEVREDLEELLHLFNIKHIENNKASRISGGESMRLSLAAAMAKKPRFILADEPTGTLDSQNTYDVIDILKNVNKNMGTTILVVTHDIRYRNVFDKSLTIRDGRLVGIGNETDKKQLDFLKDSSELNKAYIDSSGFIQIPEKIKTLIAMEDVAEFDIHPSKKLAILWNPKLIPKDEIIDILQKPAGEWIEEKQEDLMFEDIEDIFSRVFKPEKEESPIIKIKGLTRSYEIYGKKYPVIKGIDLEINKGDFIFISGPSGVGKTTLLNLIAGLIRPDEGKITIKNFSYNNKNDTAISDFRLENIAYITQYHSLFEPIPLKENLQIPYLFLKKPYDQIFGDDVSKRCHIFHKRDQYPNELSAGEKQRATLSLALTRKTPILLADEPTANLDSELARALMNVLMDVVEKFNATFIMCSHDLSLLRSGFRHIKLSDGIVTEDTRMTKNKLKKTINEYLQIENNKK
ncbi:MAG: ATP-binding cassette domain-containing protein [Asgard group archaeon]|nr:ATP-binding cassette domain-containing protein [Asgard group archaeon]